MLYSVESLQQLIVSIDNDRKLDLVLTTFGITENFTVISKAIDREAYSRTASQELLKDKQGWDDVYQENNHPDEPDF